MEDNWQLITIAALVAGDKVLSFMKDRGIDLAKMSRHIDDLHAWHSREDEDGVKVWYVRKTLETAMEKLADNIMAQTEILKEIHREHIASQKRMDRFEEYLIQTKNGPNRGTNADTN
jgi:hypothetical protein